MAAGPYPPTGASRRRRARGGGVVVPMVLILLGVVFLLRNYGLLPATVLPRLAMLWPLGLVLLGVDLVVAGRVGVLTRAALFLVVVGLGMLALTARDAVRFVAAPTPGPTASLEQPLQGATRGTVHLTFGAGRVELGALADPGDRLAAASLEGPPGMRVQPRYQVRDGAGDLTYDVGGSGVRWLPFPFAGSSSPAPTNLDLRLNPSIPLALDAKLGAADSQLDLSGLDVTRLDLQSGASSVLVRLPQNAGTTTGRVQAGAASLTIEVPPGVAAQIQFRGGVSNLDVDEARFPLVSQSTGSGTSPATPAPPPTPPAPPAAPVPPKPPAPPKPPGRPDILGGTRLYRSPDYDTAANKVDLVVESGASSVTIR